MEMSQEHRHTYTLDLPLRRLIAQLHAQLPVNPIGLGIERDRRAGPANRDRPLRSNRIDQRSLPTSHYILIAASACSLLGVPINIEPS